MLSACGTTVREIIRSGSFVDIVVFNPRVGKVVMSFISADDHIAELTLKSIVLAIILTILLAMSNAYLALKLGILTSASIPAAIISMGVLRLFKRSTILENNAVQTAASAGEAVAGGIVYTIPALVLIGYWDHFDYLTNVLIAAIGGILGVLFSIPLRRVLVYDRALRFPEGRAIAEVLKSSAEKFGMHEILMGGLVGAVLELLQTGLKLVANSWSYWFIWRGSIFGLGAGFSATMIGAGYLVGQDMAMSIILGAMISWLVALPIVSQVYPEFLQHSSVTEAANLLWSHEMRYLGIGAMLYAGIWTFLTLIKPLIRSMQTSRRMLRAQHHGDQGLPRTDRDIPLPYLLMGIGVVTMIMFWFFQRLFPLDQVGLTGYVATSIGLLAVVYVLIIGFLFSVITAYFSGMVGVTASPGSSIVIAAILLAAWLLLEGINALLPLPLSVAQMQAAEAITIMIGSIVTGIAAIANDNTQDLKVGQLVGATPWKQQVMLLLGVVVSALVIPPVMQLLFNVYGIGGVMPRAGMDLAQALPAPTAALLSAITQAVFQHAMPWEMMFSGAAIILLFTLLKQIFRVNRWVNISILGVAIGMYLPLASSVPLFLGGVISMVVKWRLPRYHFSEVEIIQKKQVGTLIACGLVAGSALMDVCLAVPFSLLHSPDALKVVGAGWDNYGVWLGILAVLLVAFWIERRVRVYTH